jgi:hypothetical protein
MLRRSLAGVVVVAALWAGPARALLIDPPQAITLQVQVQLIRVAEDSGSNPAPLLGTPSQEAAIEGFIDDIWAQAGIDILFESSVASYPDSFALAGTPGSNDPRPPSDLDAIVSGADLAGVLDPDPLVLHMFFVDIVPLFSQTDANTVNGLSYIDANGMAVWVGPNLPLFSAGREAVASVLAHEIGHNLGLSHISLAENLMQPGGSPSPGQRLDSAQIGTARSSAFAVPVPEPSSLLLLALGLALLAALGRAAPAPKPHSLPRQARSARSEP